MSSAAGVTVVGSANMDIVLTVERIPGPGETLLALSSARYPGGKGLNQAVAAARAGVATSFVGALGDDDNGRALAAAMIGSGIDDTLVRRDAGESGQAFIVVDEAGENTIIVASGANASVTELSDAERAKVRESAVVLMQLELPPSVITEVGSIGRSGGAIVMLNAAPARPLSTELLAQLDVLIVNEHEASIVAGIAELGAASALLAGLVPRLVVTLGSEGSVLYESGREVARVAAKPVTAVDTTGAGDTFCGALAAAIANGRSFADAAAFASAAAAVSVQRVGAVPSVPTLEEIESMLGS